MNLEDKKDLFAELWTEFVATRQNLSQELSDHTQKDVWELLKAENPSIWRQFFKNVRFKTKYASMPQIIFFREQLEGMRFPTYTNIEDRHYPKNQNCKCEQCQLQKSIEKHECTNPKCENPASEYDAMYCDRCHVLVKSYCCLCDRCLAYNDIVAKDKEEEDVGDLPF